MFKGNFGVLVVILSLGGGSWGQEFSFSTEYGGEQVQVQPQPEEFRQSFTERGQGQGFFGGVVDNFGQRQTSASASASGNGVGVGATSFPQRPGQGGSFPQSPGQGGGGQGGGGVDENLQATFRQIFDWNLDLASDTRFTQCRVPLDIVGNVERACPKRAFYYGFNPQHRMAVGMVKQILTGPHDPNMTVCLAGAMRDLPGMNPNVWIRGMLGAHLSDVGLFDLQVPPMVEVMPHIFLHRESLERAKRQATLNPNSRRCTVIDGTVGADNGVENRLWYFREDLQVNSFHLNWHLIYPVTGITRKADRQGELFYFTHHSHIARYHAERLSNGLGRITPLAIQQNARIPEAFDPHLNDTNSGRQWSPRRQNRVVRDTFLNITGVPPTISVADRVLHVTRVEEGINNRALLLRNGGRLPLDSRTGIDVLGDTVEATVFSPNPDYYGRFGFHNEGHVLVALVEDPQNRTGIPPGIMLEVATAMRDPVFYTYHSAMDNVFDLHKQTLQPYQPEGGELPLKWDGIEISRVEVMPDNNGRVNQLTTFFGQATFDLSRGLDFNRTGVQGPITVCVSHLDHNPFTYRIYVNRHQSAGSRATVRIFLAPRFDENGRRYTMTEQRKLFFMLDIFTVRLNRGQNRITRRSIESALTIAIPQSYNGFGATRLERVRERPRTYCGCGWPQHLLIPRGNERGMTFDLFVMLTNGNEDYVPPQNNGGRSNECKPAPIYCGRLNDTYPDARPMGYPFDRLPYGGQMYWWEGPQPVQTLEEYTAPVPNMAAIPVIITHLRGNGAQNLQDQTQATFQTEELSNGPINFNIDAPLLPQEQLSNGPINFNIDASLPPQEQEVLTTSNQNYNNPAGLGPVEPIPLIHQEHYGGAPGTNGYFDIKNNFRGFSSNLQGDFKTTAYFISPTQNYRYSN